MNDWFLLKNGFTGNQTKYIPYHFTLGAAVLRMSYRQLRTAIKYVPKQRVLTYQFGLRPITFKIDTGTDRTTISQEDLLSLGYDIPIIKLLMKKSGDGSTADGINSFS